MTTEDELLAEGFTEHAIALLADLTPTEGVASTIPLPNCTVGAEIVLMLDGRRLFSHVCDRRVSNPNRHSRFTANAGVIRCAPELDVAHRTESTDPLTITPSILCLDCGLHGYVRAGRWVPA